MTIGYAVMIVALALLSLPIIRVSLKAIDDEYTDGRTYYHPKPTEAQQRKYDGDVTRYGVKTGMAPVTPPRPKTQEHSGPSKEDEKFYFSEDGTGSGLWPTMNALRRDVFNVRIAEECPHCGGDIFGWEYTKDKLIQSCKDCDVPVGFIK